MEVSSRLIEAHIFRRRNGSLEFLLLKRSDKEIFSGIWQMVTGSIEPEEKAYLTALREIEEETGLKPRKFWVAPNINSFYSKEKDKIFMVPVFAAEVGENDDVKISDEHSEFKWLSAGEAKKLFAWPGQRNSVDLIEEYFTESETLLNFIEINLT